MSHSISTNTLSTFPGIARHPALRYSVVLAVSLVFALPSRAADLAPTNPSADELETIVITARRRKEKAQDVPAPITSLRGHSLVAQRIEQLPELTQALPGLNTVLPGTGLASRGASASVGRQGGVALYLDNVYLGQASDFAAELLDIEQVDLLRGPQVLVGRNHNAGVLYLTSRAPAFDAQGDATLTIGQYGERQIKGSYTAPVTDAFALRLAAYSGQEQGWIDGQNNDNKRQGLRLQGLLAGEGGFTLRLIAEHHRNDANGPSDVLYRYGNADIARQATLLGIAQSPDPYRTQLDAATDRSEQQSSFSAEANGVLAGGHKLTSITAWRKVDSAGRNDLDASPVPAARDDNQRRTQQRSQELRLASPSNGALDYVLGAYWLQQDIDQDRQLWTGANAKVLTGWLPNDAQLQGNSEQRHQSTAIFGQATWHLAPAIDLSAGARASHETQTLRLQQRAITLPSRDPQFATGQSGDLRRSDNSIATSLTASYKLSDHALTYLSFARSKAGAGFALDPIGSPAVLAAANAPSLAPETTRNLELGYKSTWLNNRVYLNANLFFSQIANYQTWVNQANGSPATLANAGDVRSQGIEFDLKARPSAELTLALNASYTDARFTSGQVAAPVGTAGNVAADGKRVNGIPRLSLNSNAQYHWTLPENKEPYINLSYHWRSEREGDASNAEAAKLPSYGELNLSAGLRATRIYSRWDAAIWLKNATDQRYVQTLSRANQGYYATMARPRTVGVSLRLDF